MLRESEETIRSNLYLDSEEYEYYWEEWKDDIIKTIRKYEEIYKDNFSDWSYCLESDLDSEIAYLEEINTSMKVITNEKGLIIYEYLNLED